MGARVCACVSACEHGYVCEHTRQGADLRMGARRALDGERAEEDLLSISLQVGEEAAPRQHHIEDSADAPDIDLGRVGTVVLPALGRHKLRRAWGSYRASVTSHEGHVARDTRHDTSNKVFNSNKQYIVTQSCAKARAGNEQPVATAFDFQ